MRGTWLLALAVACGPSSKQTEIPRSNKPLTAQDIVQRSSPAIVRVEAQGPEGEQFGTGFVLDKTGVIATNLHVIAGTGDIKVKLNDGTHYPAMHILNVDPVHDLVLLKVAPSKPMPTLPLGDSSKVAAGQKIVAIGNPLGVFENTVSEGLISSIRQLCEKKDDNCPGEYTLLQISAPISQGSSGGPLFNLSGEVVGITTAIIAQGQLINFAMPANYLKPLLQNQQAIALDDFAKASRKTAEAEGGGGESRLPKKPPEPEFSKNGFPISIYDNCSPDQIADVVNAIKSAIDIGAPLYNQGNLEACFRIYEGVGVKFERDSSCKGVRAAFGDVLLKTQSTENWGEKAWYMRYTFDGLVKAANAWAAKKKP
jgi:hypothetical protein